MRHLVVAELAKEQGVFFRGALCAVIFLAGWVFPVGWVQAAEPDANAVRGLVRPVSRALLSSELRDRIVKIGYRAGETFSRGDTLVSFDCKYYRAELQARTALHKAKQAQHQNNLKLLKLNATSDIEVEISAAQAEEAVAEKAKAKAQVESCTVTAPFDGAVETLMVNEFESVAPSAELMTILSHADLEIELLTPSHWVTRLAPGETFVFLVDETGTTHTCAIVRIGAAVDPVSQTVAVTAVFTDPAAAAAVPILVGMSGTARFRDAP